MKLDFEDCFTDNGRWIVYDRLVSTQTGFSELVTSRNPRRRRPVESSAPTRERSQAPSFNVDYEVLARFRYELRKFQAFSETAARNAGLTPQQHQALLAIRGFSGKNPVSVGDLAGFLLIRHHTAVELTNRMTKLGLVSRIADEADARRVFVTLTTKGEQRLRQLSRIHFEELRAIGPALTRVLKPFRRPETR